MKCLSCQAQSPRIDWKALKYMTFSSLNSSAWWSEISQRMKIKKGFGGTFSHTHTHTDEGQIKHGGRDGWDVCDQLWFCDRFQFHYSPVEHLTMSGNETGSALWLLQKYCNNKALCW